ncbi:hypothetical protein SKAU_G00356560 [Synaphobranchus kaupii]|uniref:Uncharacterized protein n=1 Tax=Synaphobranchus kaupii TaxID=118154 RepID=A0A9Q1EHG1_SYNKA|nr:hypothetical protein SKAU_G00356560 [Synaphobranchus kaupii]
MTRNCHRGFLGWPQFAVGPTCRLRASFLLTSDSAPGFHQVSSTHSGDALHAIKRHLGARLGERRRSPARK